MMDNDDMMVMSTGHCALCGIMHHDSTKTRNMHARAIARLLNGRRKKTLSGFLVSRHGAAG